MAFTAAREYSDFIATQSRGDWDLLNRVYHPVADGVRLQGELVYIDYWDPANMTVAQAQCDTFVAGSSANLQAALTKYVGVHKECFDDARWYSVTKSDASLAQLGISAAQALGNDLMPLIYTSIIDGAGAGQQIAVGAVPTGATILAGVYEGLVGITAVGAKRISIVMDSSYAGLFIIAAGAHFQPPQSLGLSFENSSGIIGAFNGIPIYATPTDLVDTSPSPDVNAVALIVEEFGYGYAPVGEGLGYKVVFHPDDENGTNTIIYKASFGYGVLDVAKLRVLLAQA